MKFALTSALKPYKIERDNVKRKLENRNLPRYKIEVLEKRLADIENKMKTINEKSLPELLDKTQGRIDWLEISSVYMNAVRSPGECENMWNNVLDLSINKGAFTKNEDEKLLELAEKLNGREWDFIADSLQTNRTAVQCFERYQTKLSRKRRFWTQEEDDHLLALVNELKYGGIIPWDKVSMLMEGRTRAQCVRRYRGLSVADNRGPWTPEEDALVIACYDKIGPNWEKIKPFFKRRLGYAIKSRYALSLDPSIKFRCPWTEDEDKHLISLIRKYGYGRWRKICKEMPNRSFFMCMRRAGLLLKYSIQYHSDKGIEYNQDAYDPELFAKILRPMGTNKSSARQYKRGRTVREDAIAAMWKALEKVAPDAKIKHLNSVNFSWLSFEQLHLVSEELHSMFLQKEKLNPLRVFQPKYPVKQLHEMKRYISETSDEIQMFPTNSKVDEGNKHWDFEFAAIQDVDLQLSAEKTPQAFSETELAEISLYKAFLFKQFSCLAVCDDDDDIENVTFSEIDYSQTLHRVVHYFIQPPVYENQFIILAPNLTTLRGFEVAEITGSQLTSMSGFVSHSKNYIDFLCKRCRSCPKCLQCHYKHDERRKDVNNNQNGEVAPQDVICSMKNKNFIVDETMEASVYVEVASKEKCIDICSCASLKKSQKSVQLLRKRFLALFLWPALLASTNFSEEQDKILYKENNDTKNNISVVKRKEYSLQDKKPRSKRKASKNFKLPTSDGGPPKVRRMTKTELPEV